VQDTKGKKAAVPDSPLGRDEQPHLYMVPKKYRKVVFKYSKLGEEENEMIQHYNKTNFAGLDPNVPNAYCNCMLQASAKIAADRVVQRCFRRVFLRTV